MSEAEEILARLECGRRSFRAAFCVGVAGLATLVAAYAGKGVADVIRTKGMHVIGADGTSILGVAAVVNHKVAVGTVKSGNNLVSAGEGATGQGVIALSAPNGATVVRLDTMKNGGGSFSINGPDGREIANASPNTTNAGSVFIENSSGTLIGEINGDKVNGGVIAVHDASGKETARVHQGKEATHE